MAEKYLYVVFQQTTLGMGKLIRSVTGFGYNHVGISLSANVRFMYSFARHYKAAPFYGGFNKESVLRCKNGEKTAKIKICAVPVTEKQYEEAKKHLEFFEKHSEDYIYNMISAVCFPLGIRVKIKGAYTCSEFVLSMLKKYADIPVLKSGKFFSIKQLCKVLEPYEIYEGSAEKYLLGANWGKDTFAHKKGKYFYCKKTVFNNGRLFYRLFKENL